MLPQVRAVLVLTLSLALWAIADGVKCLVSGTYFGRVLSDAALPQHPYALALPTEQYIDYGPWAAWLVQLGVDPHALAPFFIGLGVVGLLGLFLFLQARPVGWALLVAFSLVSTAKVGLVAVVAVVLLVVLLLPATRRLLETTLNAPPERA
jgi:hypothetical protein